MIKDISLDENNMVSGGGCDCWCKPARSDMGVNRWHVGLVAMRPTCVNACLKELMAIDECY